MAWSCRGLQSPNKLADQPSGEQRITAKYQGSRSKKHGCCKRGLTGGVQVHEESDRANNHGSVAHGKRKPRFVSRRATEPNPQRYDDEAKNRVRKRQDRKSTRLN